MSQNKNVKFLHKTERDNSSAITVFVTTDSCLLFINMDFYVSPTPIFNETEINFMIPVKSKNHVKIFKNVCLWLFFLCVLTHLSSDFLM